MPRFCSRKNRAHSKCQIQYKITTLLNGTNGKEHPQLRRHSVYSAAPALSPTVSIKRIQVTMVRRQAQSSPHIQKTWVRQFNNGCSLYRHQRKFLCKKKNALIFLIFLIFALYRKVQNVSVVPRRSALAAPSAVAWLPPTHQSRREATGKKCMKMPGGFFPDTFGNEDVTCYNKLSSVIHF